MLNTVLALAVLPALILLYYTYQQDKLQREPTTQIVIGFFLGWLSVLCSFFISVPSLFIGLSPDTDSITSFWDAVRVSFFAAAIPEETAKLFCLWLLLRKNPYFDERMDGIVYAVCIGMGFASFENIAYLLSSEAGWIVTGIGRSITAIPGHFGFAVLMGYFYSLYHFDRQHSKGAGLKMWLYPVLAHGIYDTIAMSTQLTDEMTGIVVIVLLLFCFLMVRWAQKSMKKHLLADEAEMNPGAGQIFPDGDPNFPNGGMNFPSGGPTFPNGGVNIPDEERHVPDDDIDRRV